MMLHINYYLNIPENSLIYDMIKERFLWIMHKRGWNTWIFNNQFEVVLSSVRVETEIKYFTYS